MAFTLGSNGTLFASLAFGAIFLATVGAGGPPRTMLVGGEMLSLAAAGALLLAAAAGTLAARALPRGAVVATALALVATLVAQAAAAAMLAMLALSIPAPHEHALGACSLVLAVYAMLHAALGAVLAGYCLWRLRNLHLAPTRAADVRTCSLWHGYTAAAGIAAIALVHALATGLIG
jgi:cytochrome c oxidase subunit I+III